MEWLLEKIILDLKFLFKISRNESTQKTNFILKLTIGNEVGFGECAPNIRYGETVEATENQLKDFINKQLQFKTLNDLHVFISNCGYFQSVKNAIETCFIDAYSKTNNKSIGSLFNISLPRPKATMFTIPIMESSNIEDFYKLFGLDSFEQIKIKIDNKIGAENIKKLRQIAPNKKLFVDANEAFLTLESYLDFESEIESFSVTFIEQPFPALETNLYKKLKLISKYPIFGDESIIANVDIEEVALQFHGVNVKMMKAGGFMESIRILQKAKEKGLQTMVGCMVETSIGIGHAFQLNALTDYLDLDSFVYIKNEPYQITEIDRGIIRIC